MGTHEVGSLLVVSGGALLGIVTDRDIVLRAASTGQSLHVDLNILTVMSEAPTVIQGSADVFEVFQTPERYGGPSAPGRRGQRRCRNHHGGRPAGLRRSSSVPSSPRSRGNPAPVERISPSVRAAGA